MHATYHLLKAQIIRSDADEYDVTSSEPAQGIASAALIQKQDSSLSIALVDPAESHYYQPGWTLWCRLWPRLERSGQWLGHTKRRGLDSVGGRVV